MHRAAATAVAAAALAVSAACASAAPAAGDAGAAARTTPGAAASYLVIADEGNKRLDTDFDRFDKTDRGDLAASIADLRDIAVTEHRFDQRLDGLTLPAAPAFTARTLITVNEARAALTRQAAAATSMAQLDGYRARLTAADAPVEQAVRAIRAELGLPAPDTD